MKPYDQIKNQLQAFESDLDKEKLWANTAHAIPKRKRRYGVIVLFLFGALFLGSGLVFLSYDVSTNRGNSSADVLQDSQSSMQDLKPSQTESTTKKNDVNEDDYKANNSSPLESATHSVDNKSVSGTASNAKNQTQYFSEENQSKQEIIATPFVASELEVHAKNEMPEVSLTEVKTSDEELIPSSFELESQESALQEEVSVAELAVLPILPLPVKAPDLLAASNTAVLKGNSKKTFALYASQSIGASSLNVQAESDELLARENFIEDHVTSLENFSTRLGAQMHLSKKWVFGAGLQWNQLTTRTDFAWTEEERLSGDGITGIVIDPDGTQHFQSGVIGITRESQWQASRYSTHTTLNLEAQIAYQVIRHYRFDLLAGLHGTCNLLYNSKGSTFDVNDQPVEYTSADQLYTLTSPFNIGLSLTGSYQIGRRLGLQLTLQADRLNYEQRIDQSAMLYHHHIFSMGIGLRYTL